MKATRRTSKPKPYTVASNGRRYNSHSLGVQSRRFAYDAVEDRGKRKAAQPITRDEDQELKGERKRKLISAARDLPRNFAIAAWAIRKHLDYVSSFEFKSRTGNRDVDMRIEELMRERSRKENCDVSNRHSLRRLMRLWERHRTVDGDVLIVRMRDGRLQTIEADRCRLPIAMSGVSLPGGLSAKDFTEGVRLDKFNKAIGYAISDRRRDSSDLVFNRVIPADFVEHLAYFERNDQVRGISPLSSAVNNFRDTYEGINAALAKAKIAQMFAMLFTRQSGDVIGNVEVANSGETDDEGNPLAPKYNVDFDRGPVKLELDPGEDAKFLQNEHPSNEFRDFMETVIAIALKSLDIPISFYDEGRANFSSGRQGWLLYDQSAKSKREDVRDVLSRITFFWILDWVLSGELVLPAGWLAKDVRFEWLHTGIPWIDPLKEVAADVEQIRNGLNSRTRILRERNIDFDDIVIDLAYENELMRALAIPENDGNKSGARESAEQAEQREAIENAANK